MSFEKLDIKDTSTKEGRSCIILCNFATKELKLAKSYSKVIGLNDQISVSYKNGESKIRDIITNTELYNNCDGPKDKAVLFNNVSSFKINLFIENLKKLRINNTLIATVTDTSLDWTLNTLISTLVTERIAIKNGRNIDHN